MAATVTLAAVAAAAAAERELRAMLHERDEALTTLQTRLRLQVRDGCSVLCPVVECCVCRRRR
jgi:hypothetical protein